MKPQFLLILTIFCAFNVLAQPWSGPVPGSIYYNQGNVGIGTASPAAILHIGGSQIAQYSSMIIDNTQTNLVGGCIRSGLLIRANTTNAGNNIDMVDGLIIASPTLTSGGGTFQNLRGITIQEQTGASRNTDLLIGTAGSHLIPGGDFAIYSASTRNSYLAGNIGIGTTSPEAKLTVKGKIVASEIQVKDVGAIPDYVFKPDYELMQLNHLEEFVKQNRHLPEVPSEMEFKENGMNIAEMNAILLKKIEELTLYVIEQSKQEIEQTKQISQLKEENKAIRNLIAK